MEINKEQLKKELINKLLNNMANQNNIIDLNAYSLGLSNMFDELQTIKEPEEKECCDKPHFVKMYKECQSCGHIPCNYIDLKAELDK
jgi:hypothetical protein